MESEHKGVTLDISTGEGTQTPEEAPATTATPGETVTEEKPGTGTQGEGDGNGGEGGEDGDINPDTGAPYTAEEWRDKFRASARGANELLTAKQALEAEIAKVRADGDKTVKEKEEEIANLRKLAEGKNPDGLSLLDLQKKYGEVAAELAVSKENKLIDDFIASTKVAGAESFKETLRALARANASVPLATLWDNNLKVAAEAAAKAAADRDTTRRRGASDSGRGSSSREHRGETVGKTGLTLAEFNALPVMKRRALLVQEEG